ncbi:addiction module protein [Saccharospirillum mangrovi]|uniref:addiction module protein n=1 Tax=Saccharospirillum mangrovi TaxID=2161747 RepID=UPI000D356B41|nr:addiction module protein [Saccharospirillum mangrovi]
MDAKQITQEALHLPEAERAQLIRQLVSSLESITEEPVLENWMAEAERRAAELDEGKVELQPSDAVFTRARQLNK